MLSRKPEKGDRVAWRDAKGRLYNHAKVLRIEDNLCWIKPDDGSESAPFIWHFPRDQMMNQLAELIAEPAYNKASESAHVEG